MGYAAERQREHDASGSKNKRMGEIPFHELVPLKSLGSPEESRFANTGFFIRSFHLEIRLRFAQHPSVCKRKVSARF